MVLIFTIDSVYFDEDGLYPEVIEKYDCLWDAYGNHCRRICFKRERSWGSDCSHFYLCINTGMSHPQILEIIMKILMIDILPLCGSIVIVVKRVFGNGSDRPDLRRLGGFLLSETA